VLLPLFEGSLSFAVSVIASLSLLSLKVQVVKDYLKQLMKKNMFTILKEPKHQNTVINLLMVSELQVF